MAPSKTMTAEALARGRKQTDIENMLHVLRRGLPGDDMRLFTEDLRDDRRRLADEVEAAIRSNVAAGMEETVVVRLIDALTALGSHDALYALALAAYALDAPQRSAHAQQVRPR